MFDFSPAQCAAGRVLARCSAQGLANKAGVSLALVTAFEAGEPVAPRERRLICDALHKRLFLRPIPETPHAGEGVRLRKTPAARHAEIIGRLGGVVSADWPATAPARR